MSPEERAKILRQRFKTLYPGRARPIEPKSAPRKKVAQRKPSKGYTWAYFLAPNSGLHDKPLWVSKNDDPDESPIVAPLKSRKEPHPFTVISRKLKRGEIVWTKYRH